MYKIIIAVVLGVLCQATPEQSVKDEPWQSEFETFLAFLDEADARAANDLESLKEPLVDRRVQWKGTLKYVNKGRPYIRESFVTVGKDTKAARVMYYPDPQDPKAWTGIGDGSAVEYSGVIKDVKVATFEAGQPFIYVELHQVTLVK